ncbi:MAG: hypothetical protein D6805_08470 [Planctomycetota bacterium]|nr:MAG: hypothetical protein D6805_08470 [Planctomycetota bacterium]
MFQTITLLSDFGYDDHFVGAIKGVIRSIYAQVCIVDISHSIPPQNVYKASLVLSNAYYLYPQGTIHTAIVDPTVGSQRKILIAQANGHIFLAPDNGLLSPILSKYPHKIYVWNENIRFRNYTSSTFHGRDVFAPLAAWIARGIPLEYVGIPQKNYQRLDVGIYLKKENCLMGQIIWIDHFGNLISNIPTEDFYGPNFCIRIKGYELRTLAKSYFEGNPQQPIALKSSDGYLEIAIRDSNASQIMGVKEGEKIVVEFL